MDAGSDKSLQTVEAGGHAGGAKAVVDVDNGDVGGATVEHPEERGDATEAGAVADAGGNGDDRHGDEAADDAGKRAFHSGNTNNHARLRQLFSMLEQAVNPGDANVVQMLGAVAHHAGRQQRFFRYRNVARPGGNHEDRSFSGNFLDALDDDPPWQSRDLQTANASGARWLCPERARRFSRIPEFSAIQADSYSPAAVNSIIAERHCLSLTCPNAAARLILPARKTCLTLKNRLSPWV